MGPETAFDVVTLEAPYYSTLGLRHRSRCTRLSFLNILGSTTMTYAERHRAVQETGRMIIKIVYIISGSVRFRTTVLRPCSPDRFVNHSALDDPQDLGINSVPGRERPSAHCVELSDHIAITRRISMAGQLLPSDIVLGSTRIHQPSWNTPADRQRA